MFRDGTFRALERNERRDTGLYFWTWSGSTLAILKDAGIRPEVREELMRVVRNGRMSLEAAWKREEGMGVKGAGSGMVRHN